MGQLCFVNDSTGWAAGAEGLLLKTSNGGETWNEQTTFTSRKINALWFLNEMNGWLVGDQGIVSTTIDGGESWQGLSDGLPQADAYLNVFREGLATDSLDPVGVYVGTGTGQVFYSRDEGDTWQVLSDTLPPIYSVGTAVIT